MVADWAKRRFVFSMALMISLAGCATGGTTGARRGSSTRLVEADFADYVSQDILTVIQRLRPQWLRTRGGGTAQGKAIIQVIIDGQRYNGGPDVLRSVRAESVEEVSYMNAADATTRYGTDMAGGAIVVVTKH